MVLLRVKSRHCGLDPSGARDEHCWSAMCGHRSFVGRNMKCEKQKSPDREIEARSRVYRLI